MKYLFLVVILAAAALASEHQEDAQSIQAAKDEDRSFFFRFIDELIFDDSFDRSTGRMFRERGLLGMPMPESFKDENSFTGRMYADFKNMCYMNACRFGLNNLVRTVSSMFGIA